MRGVALHHGEHTLHPPGQALVILARNDGLATDVVSDVVKVEATAARICFPEQCWDVGALHETVSSRGSPEARCDLLDLEPSIIADPRDRFGAQREDEEPFVQRTIVLQMPYHYRWRITQRPCQKDGGTGHARDLPLGDLCHERAHRDHGLLNTRQDRLRSLVPDEHDPVDQRCEKQWHITALSDLLKVGREKSRIDENEHSSHCPCGNETPAPDLPHGDKEKR